MQNKFVGDVGDFGKYGLLRTLCGRDLRLGVVWCFVRDRGIEYLERPGRFKDCDASLFEALDQLVRSCRRRLETVEESEILPEGTVFCRQPVPTRLEKRKAWAHQASEETKHCDLVFLDPDNGLRADPLIGDKVSARYVYYKDLEPFLRQSQTLVIYHDLGRVRKEAEKTEVDSHASALRSRGNIVGDIWALRWGAFLRRAYFIITNGREADLEPRIRALLSGRWGQHFQPLLFR